MRLTAKKQFAFAFMGLIIVMGSIGSEKMKQEGKWIRWEGLEADFSKEKGYTISYSSYFEASASGRYVVQVWSGVQVVKGKPRHERYEIGIEGMAASEPRIAVIWEVGKDGRLLRRVWSSEGREWLVLNVEWVKEQLLLSVLPGAVGAEHGVVMLQSGPGYNRVKVVAINPEDCKESIFTNVPATILLGSLKGDKVLLCKGGIRADVPFHFSVHSFPDGAKMSGFTWKGDYMIKNFGSAVWDRSIFYPAGGEGAYLLDWASDGEHIWVVGEQEGPKLDITGGRPAPVPVLFGIDMKGNVKLWSGNAKKGEWVVVQASGVIVYEGAGGLLVHTMRPQILEDGRLAIMLGRKPRLGFFSMKHLRKEYFFEPEMYPDALKRILKEGAKRDQGGGARILAITSDGKRLILQEGGEGGADLDKSKLFWAWAWELENNRMERLGELAYVEKVFGWLGKEYLMVQATQDLRREPMDLVREYGVIHVPSN